MKTWDEIRTAYQVARLGTVSGAADVLGVHHATVIRHIDALEGQLGVKLFQRHARGYTATEAGTDLLQVAQATDDQFIQLAGRIRGRGASVTGELVVTSIAMLSPLLNPVMIRFQRDHPGLIVRFLTDDRVFRLEYGEAHVAIRAGAAPEGGDNVVQPFVHDRFALYGSKDYLALNGAPESDEDLANHKFVVADGMDSKAPFFRWLFDRVPQASLSFRATDGRVMRDAIQMGAGLGFLSSYEARLLPDLVQVMPPRPEWRAQLWLVTHVDLHRTMKVQSFLAYLKDAAKSWPLE
ncbi:LysR family transcriptional regulator [Oceaniovalibus sp. ACAM 378]|uniref:LysR family transcriptional regulator n=1 Tax=Oceaniovalibus sp. ACAM 378 TaxID=2599923 RepID=UPI0011D8719C|nr:LysR family transcriptional regulator [Oceaniovalibus sp. ACAM 378]TYB90833.1 LysR family transcriptional regulator [Oceaniovalibus sp. ACAM 378]